MQLTGFWTDISCAWMLGFESRIAIKRLGVLIVQTAWDAIWMNRPMRAKRIIPLQYNIPHHGCRAETLSRYSNRLWSFIESQPLQSIFKSIIVVFIILLLLLRVCLLHSRIIIIRRFILKIELSNPISNRRILNNNMNNKKKHKNALGHISLV